MPKATQDGAYTTTDEYGRVHRFRVRKGGLMPKGAEFESEADAAKKAVPAKPATKKAGPAETTADTGPAETT